jgi:carboxylesterase
LSVDVSPFDLPGEADAAALCLHGLTGTPHEVRPLGLALSRAGVRAVGPALPGHNATPADLARVPYARWLEAARDGAASLAREHAKVFAVGLSLGGLLSLALAAEGRVQGLAVVGTPLRLRIPLVETLVPLLKHAIRYAPKRGGSDIRDPRARSLNPSYAVMPLASVHELIRLQRQVRSCLGRVTAPILVAHGVHDSTAHPDDAREIVARVASAERELLWLERSAHVAPLDFDGELLSRSVAGHLRRLA